jgi:hypothetical protein
MLLAALELYGLDRNSVKMLGLMDRAENESAGSDGSGVAVVAGKGILHHAPVSTIVSEERSDPASQFSRSLGEVAATNDFKKLKIPLFLPRD